MEVMCRFDRYHSLSVFPLEDGSVQAVHSGAAVDTSALSAAVERASADLLSLLSVALFHLLFLSVAGILLGHLLVFFFLLLLQLLVFLILFGG